ncbi:MAG: hypothetical protein ABIR84_12645 [Candidatus Nitrotoga sp.]
MRILTGFAAYVALSKLHKKTSKLAWTEDLGQLSKMSIKRVKCRQPVFIELALKCGRRQIYKTCLLAVATFIAFPIQRNMRDREWAKKSLTSRNKKFVHDWSMSSGR